MKMLIIIISLILLTSCATQPYIHFYQSYYPYEDGKKRCRVIILEKNAPCSKQTN